MTESRKIDRILNLSGLLCPNPSLITARKLADMKRGEIIEVVCSDRSVKDTIPALCREGACEVVDFREEKGLLHFIIRK